MVKRAICLMLCAVMLLLCSCKDNKKEDTSSALSDYPAKAFDITVKKCPQKVISLSPVVTDIIIALGSDAQLTGISDDCVEHRELARFGSSVRPDITAIKEAKPDLLFVSDGADDADIKLLTNAGISVAEVTIPNKYVELANLYSDIGVLMSGNITGIRNAANTFNTIDGNIKKASNTNSVKVKAAVFINSSVTLPDGCLAAELARYAGFDTLLNGSDEKIIEAQPQLVLCPEGMKEEFEGRFEGVKIAELDMSRFDRRGAQMTELVTDLIALIEQ